MAIVYDGLNGGRGIEVFRGDAEREDRGDELGGPLEEVKVALLAHANEEIWKRMSVIKKVRKGEVLYSRGDKRR